MGSDQAIRFQNWTWVIAFAGLVPFAIMAGSMLYAGSGNAIVVPAFNFFKLYSAIILSFMGGIRWGYALSNEDGEGEPLTMFVSILPALIAWGVLLLPDAYNQLILMVLLLCFCALGAWDSLSANARKLPQWYAKLRIILTLSVAACHIAVFFAIGGVFS